MNTICVIGAESANEGKEDETAQADSRNALGIGPDLPNLFAHASASMRSGKFARNVALRRNRVEVALL